MSAMNKHKNTLKSRRQCLLMVSSVTGASIAMPTSWVKPVVNSMLLPAHAQSSTMPTLSCSEIIVEPIRSNIEIQVMATEVIGPIMVNLITPTRFSGSESIIAGTCNNGEVMRQEVLFEGEIDTANNQITGLLEVDVFCGNEVACEQRSTFTSVQTPVNPGVDLGDYLGTLNGTSSCCADFFTTMQSLQLVTN